MGMDSPTCFISDKSVSRTLIVCMVIKQEILSEHDDSTFRTELYLV